MEGFLVAYHIRVKACTLILENDSILLVEFNNENGLHYNLPADELNLMNLLLKQFKGMQKRKHQLM